ncbi:transcriptional regulator [Candidatus Omnitrophus magneticus]|uniref:Transcriptional regulator n=1 Tax=Candidatus Omnitrophus magneticus TaxID=1609969 RepID=A0A0F0CQT1_9BACT|nr:transcriptional regulator [Candidatus Omnitrophus magneticus]
MTKRKKFRQRRDFKKLEERRMKAGKMFSVGTRQSDVARKLNVSTPSVARWHAAWKKGGTNSLKGAGRAGRKPRITKKTIIASRQSSA